MFFTVLVQVVGICVMCESLLTSRIYPIISELEAGLLTLDLACFHVIITELRNMLLTDTIKFSHIIHSFTVNQHIVLYIAVKLVEFLFSTVHI